MCEFGDSDIAGLGKIRPHLLEDTLLQKESCHFNSYGTYSMRFAMICWFIIRNVWWLFVKTCIQSNRFTVVDSQKVSLGGKRYFGTAHLCPLRVPTSLYILSSKRLTQLRNDLFLCHPSFKFTLASVKWACQLNCEAFIPLWPCLLLIFDIWLPWPDNLRSKSW